MADWWEDVAKPAIIAFCRRFAADTAKRRRELRYFICHALQRSLENNDWPQVALARARLKELDAAAAAGAAVRAHAPLADQEQPAAFHAQQEGRHGANPGLREVKTAAGAILTSEADVEAEVSSFFTALFHGRHVASNLEAGPIDSGQTFQPDENLFPGLLDGLPSLSQEDKASLEVPLTMDELEDAVEAAARHKSPGLDGLSYEFYRATLHSVGPALLEALNAMLNRGLLSASLRHGVVRLIPKVPGVPTASQLRPITLLGTDYKLLTKMLVARLLPLLPSVLLSTQLCSVRGRSIFDGPASVLSAAEFLHRHKLPGYLLSLDFFHAYDRVSLPWLDKVMEAMGFGLIFRGWIATLHREASASFLLHGISPALAILFSIRQGDPLAALLFILYIEPFLVRLEAALTGLRVANIREASFGYMDDVEVLGDKLSDIIIMDQVCRDFEAASGAILNRNRKTVILGLGSWAGRSQWPLDWLHSVNSVKVLGFVITPTFLATVEATWDLVLTGVEATLRMWGGRRLDTLAQRVQVLEMFALSKVWYFAHVLPLSPTSSNPPPAVAPAVRLRRAIGDFLWDHRLRRLAFDECHAGLTKGGLSLSCPQTRAQSMLVKQACRQLADGGRPALHLAYWIGFSLRGLYPALASAGLTLVDQPPPQYAGLLDLLRETFTLDCVNTNSLQETQSAAIYKEWTLTLPTPRVERVTPDLPWDIIWPRLALPGLRPADVDVHFSLLHDLLNVRANLHHWGQEPAPDCQRCRPRPPAPQETVLHFFTACGRTGPAWGYLIFRVALTLGVAITDKQLLFLAWPPTTALRDGAATLAVLAFTSWAWRTRDLPDVLLPPDVRLEVLEAAAASPWPSIL